LSSLLAVLISHTASNESREPTIEQQRMPMFGYASSTVAHLAFTATWLTFTKHRAG